MRSDVLVLSLVEGTVEKEENANCLQNKLMKKLILNGKKGLSTRFKWSFMQHLPYLYEKLIVHQIHAVKVDGKISFVRIQEEKVLYFEFDRHAFE